MDLSTAFTHHFDDLSRAGFDELEGTAPLVAALSRDVRAAVPSFCGLQITMHEQGYPVVVTAFDTAATVRDLATTLQLPLNPPVTTDLNGSITFYARSPGAFIDLAADLTYALRLPEPRSGPAFPPAGSGETTMPDPADVTTDATKDGSRSSGCDGPVGGQLVLDSEVPPTTLVSGVTGLVELSRVGRAAGVLIERGHLPDDADGELRRQAAAAHLAPHVYATLLLDEVREKAAAQHSASPR